MNDTLYAIASLASLASMATSTSVPAVVVAACVLRFVRANEGRGAALARALVALVVWAPLSYGMVFAFFIGGFLGGLGGGASQPGDRFAGAIVLLVSGVVYILIGYGLARWVQHSNPTPNNAFEDGRPQADAAQRER